MWLNAHAGCKMMAEYRPGSYGRRNMLAKFLWGRFKKGGYMNAKEIWRTAPMMFDIHTFNYANEYALDLGSDILLASFATPWNYTKIYRENGSFRFYDIFGVTHELQYTMPDENIRVIFETIDEVKRNGGQGG